MVISIRSIPAIYLVVLIYFLILKEAQAQDATFDWGFTDPNLGQSHPPIAECSRLNIMVEHTNQPDNQPAKPPYYLIAYPVKGIPKISPIGSIAKNLAWTVPFSAGTALLLQVVDSQMNTGGVDAPIYNVVHGSNTSCHGPDTHATPVTIRTNTTGSLSTCDSLLVDLDGGTPPYTISFIPQNTTSVNVTLLPANNEFVWTNLVLTEESSTLLVTASDSKGNYAVSTDLIALTGSSNPDCPDQSAESHRGNSSSIGSTTTSASAINPSQTSLSSSSTPTNMPSSPPRKTGVIVGSVIGVLALLIIVTLTLLYLQRRRRRQHVQTEPHSMRENTQTNSFTQTTSAGRLFDPTQTSSSYPTPIFGMYDGNTFVPLVSSPLVTPPDVQSPMASNFTPYHQAPPFQLPVGSGPSPGVALSDQHLHPHESDIPVLPRGNSSDPMQHQDGGLLLSSASQGSPPSYVTASGPAS